MLTRGSSPSKSRRRTRVRAAKNRKRVTAATEAVNVRIRELKDGTQNSVRRNDNRTSVDITKSVRQLYQFGNSGVNWCDDDKGKIDGTFRRLVSIIESATEKTGPSFETPEGLEHTFQAVFLQDSEIQRIVVEILEEVTRQTRLYRFCAIYVPISMENWLRDNLNEPKKTRSVIPFVVANPFEGQYIVEKEDGDPTFSIYFVPEDEKVLDTHMVAIYECNPRFIYRDAHRDRIFSDKGSAGSSDEISLWSPYWEFIQRRDEFTKANENEKLADMHRSTYVDYVTPPIPKDLDYAEMTEQQILQRGALAVHNGNPGMQANARNLPGMGAPELSFDDFMSHVYGSGVNRGYEIGAGSVNSKQSADNYNRESRIRRLQPGETVNRNPHVALLRDPRALKKEYELDLSAEMNVPISRYRMAEKGSYRKDDNMAEGEMFSGTIASQQREMSAIFYFLYQHTLGIIDDKLLNEYRSWERKIAFSSEDIDLLKEIGIGTGGIGESDVALISDKTGSALSRASFLVSEISQLTPFDIAMFSYMNSIEVPQEEQRHLVTVEFLPPPETATTSLKDYIDVYNSGILQEEMIQAIRSRLNLPEPEGNEEKVVDPNPRPSKRARTTTTKEKEQKEK